MFAADLAPDYLRILLVMQRAREEHELEILREDLYQRIVSMDCHSCTGVEYDDDRFESELRQLEEWDIIHKRLEKTRIRSYKDVRRVLYRYHLADDSRAFLRWLVECHEHDLLPHEDDSINLLEFILSSLKQLSRGVKSPGEHFSSVVFSLGDVQEKTARLTGNLTHITIELGEFLLRVYTPEEAKSIVHDIEGYFQNYLQQLIKLRIHIVKELEHLMSPENEVRLKECSQLFKAEQAKVPRFMRMASKQENPVDSLRQLYAYYKLNGKIDQLCSSVRTNVMSVVGKLTSYLKELERRSNRLEFIDLRLHELASQKEDFEPHGFLRELLGSCAAPLDMNDADEYQKAEPPPPRIHEAGRRQPPKVFSRTPRLGENSTETHAEMQRRLLREFLRQHYPDNGVLSKGKLNDHDFPFIALLLKYGLLGDGGKLSEMKKHLRVDLDHQGAIAGEHYVLSGPETIVEEGGV